MNAALETRVDRLELVLEQFIVQTNAMMARMERDTKQLRQELRQERETSQRELTAFREEMRQARETSERNMTIFKEEMRQDMNEFREEMQQSREAFHHEMRAEMTEFKQQMNKRWGNLANSLGRVVEDIVAPSIPYIINKYFAAQNIYLLSERVVKQRASPPPRSQEFDAIAVFDDKILINETKSQPRLEYIHKFLHILTDWQQFFPEYADKKLIPIFSSLHLPATTVAYLTEQKIYALAMREDGMEILNQQAIQEVN